MRIFFKTVYFGTKSILIYIRPLIRLFQNFITSFGKKMRVARSGLLVKRNKAAAGISAMTTAGTPVSDCDQLLPRWPLCAAAAVTAAAATAAAAPALKKRLCESQEFVFIE